jgi:DNA-binding PadR family transcriptional regulator
MPKPESLLPLKPLVFDVLLALHESERHGYGIAMELHARSPFGARVLPGNLYRTLRGMLDQDLIEKSPRRDIASEQDERRRYFRITAFGRQVARAEAVRLQDRVSAARAQKLLPGSERS